MMSKFGFEYTFQPDAYMTLISPDITATAAPGLLLAGADTVTPAGTLILT
jgi:hypothetical protein